MTTSLIQNKLQMYERFLYAKQFWQDLAGGARIGFQNTVYLSEKQSATRNYCLAYLMKDSDAFPPGINIQDTLELYFQFCSIEVTTRDMSVLASSLANGGVCPLTGVRIFAEETVSKILSLMHSCGMYDYSGEWAFSIGIPAKSGVAGCIFLVVPGVMGICTYSPPLDERGNSVRGIEFCKRLLKRYTLHRYD